MENPVIYENDTVMVYSCGCRASKLEYPYEDVICETHTPKDEDE